MNEHFLDALVVGFEAIIPTLTLPDPNDRNVLAAAIKSRSDVLITLNLKDFAPQVLRANRIAAAHPDDFVDYLFGSDEDKAFAAVAGMRARLRAPPMTSTQFISSIENAGLPKVAAKLPRKMTRI
jgi:hypothetical protein